MSNSGRKGPFIRKYNPKTDFEAAVHVFRETSDESLKIEPVWTIGSYIWCRPYLLVSPETSFVVDDGTGVAVGYVIGVPDSTKFCQQWNEQYLPIVTQELESLAR